MTSPPSRPPHHPSTLSSGGAGSAISRGADPTFDSSRTDTPRNDSRGLSPRRRRVLYAVVSEYIATGEPVGSRTISKRYGIDLSPATIRNELADLEDAGYLVQPHTSAGRIPTDLGFRTFIDALVQVNELSPQEKAIVAERVGRLRPGVDDVVREAGRVLASLSGAASVIMRPRTDIELLSQMRFLPLNEGAVLSVVITTSGSIHNRVVQLDHTLRADEIERINRVIEELLPGRTMTELRVALDHAIEADRTDDRILKKNTGALVEEVHTSSTQTNSAEHTVVIEGQGGLFERPEFSDGEKIKSFLRAFDQKEQLVTLLERTMESEGVQVFVGSEAELSTLSDVGFISSEVTVQGSTAGAVGVIGPSRLDYAKLMPLVRYTADTVSQVLAGAKADTRKDKF